MSPSEKEAKGELLLYAAEDGSTRVQVRFEGDTLWLSQRKIAELFVVSVPTVNEQVAGIYEDDELDPGATIRKFRVVKVKGIVPFLVSLNTPHCQQCSPLDTVFAQSAGWPSMTGA